MFQFVVYVFAAIGACVVLFVAAILSNAARARIKASAELKKFYDELKVGDICEWNKQECKVDDISEDRKMVVIRLKTDQHGGKCTDSNDPYCFLRSCYMYELSPLKNKA